MADALATDTQIKGLRLAVGRRQVNERFVMEGQNFLLDAKGPYAEFGSDMMFHAPMYNPEGAQTFEIEDEIFIVTSEGFFVYLTTANTLAPRYVFASAPTGNFPWSVAHVGGTYYFARKGYATIVSYNPSTLVWTNFSTNVPATPHAVAAVAGRLVILGASVYTWSAIDDGTDLATSTVTGAGSQSLALINNGAPLGIMETDDGGVIYTDAGLIKMESINSINPFRHYVLITKIRPISAYAIVNNDGEHIFLAESGFYTTRGRKPERWQPLMSEYFHKTVFTNFNFANTTYIRLWYNYHRQWLVVSIVDTSGNAYLYDYAYVLYLPRDEWGMFNRQHYSIGEYWLDNVEYESQNVGYIDADGYVRKFTDAIGVQVPLVPGPYFQNHLSYIIPTYQVDGTYHFSSVIQTFPGREYINLPTSGIYTFEYVDSYISPNPVAAGAQVAATVTLGEDWVGGSGSEDWNALTGSEDWNTGDDCVFPTVGAFGAGLALYDTVAVTATYTPLNSSIAVGLYRVSDQLVPDRLSFITDVIVGSDAGDNFNITITGTLDGVTQFEAETETLTLVKTDAEMDYYTCYNNGIYHHFNISATAAGQTFHLKLLEASGTLGGRL